MKQLTFLIFLFVLTNISFTQAQNNVLFNKKVHTPKFHTIDDLRTLKKGDLLKLYIKRIHEISSVLPYMALTNEPGVSLSDLGIRENSDNLKMLEEHHDVHKEAFKTQSEMMNQFVAYADTEKIILSILYFEEIIKKMRIGIGGNF
jgi:hypothetical protein